MSPCSFRLFSTIYGPSNPVVVPSALLWPVRVGEYRILIYPFSRTRLGTGRDFAAGNYFDEVDCDVKRGIHGYTVASPAAYIPGTDALPDKVGTA